MSLGFFFKNCSFFLVIFGYQLFCKRRDFIQKFCYTPRVANVSCTGGKPDRQSFIYWTKNS